MPDQPTEITARWKGGLGFEAVNAQGVSVSMDSPSQNPYLTPMELVLMALAGCTGMDAADILRKKRQEVDSMEIRVRGTRADSTISTLRRIGNFEKYSAATAISASCSRVVPYWCMWRAAASAWSVGNRFTS